ncbi:hypothetical protein CAC42_8206 [Sphaceloma murrayae]|uniref:Rhodopsin domain-containing protein n=1 Tax=Sphaceloma murrayae TaxID=2082308 RepID=A0A2K1QJ72_9PEZI|nr:hypothetical protein CAC42_8206 [Sphaceloma murrayae]
MFGLLMRRAQNGESDTYEASISVPEILASIEDVKIIAGVLLALVVLSVSLRFYVRIFITKIIGPEDWSMLATFLCSLAQSAISIVSCDISEAQWKGDTSASSARIYAGISKASGVLYILILIGLKISLGFFFLNIFSHKKRQRIIIYVIMGLSAFFGIAYLPLGYGTCAQLKVFPGLKTTCPAAVQTAASVVFGIFSLITIAGDFALTLMAIVALWTAKLPVPTKVSACLLLVLGSAGGVASTVRMAIVLKKTDPVAYTQELFLLVKWVLVEIALGIIAANLAMVRPLFHKVLVKMGVITSTQVTKTGVTGTAKSGTRRTRGDPTGEDLLLEEIKREVNVTVVVDSEKGSGEFDMEGARPHGV